MNPERGTASRAGGRRIPADSGRGLGQLVLAVLEIVRELLERQALRRADSGELVPEEVERLGQALMSLDLQFAELREALAIDGPTDFSLPLTDLFDERQPHPER
jgi:hypothetical protein